MKMARGKKRKNNSGIGGRSAVPQPARSGQGGGDNNPTDNEGGAEAEDAAGPNGPDGMLMVLRYKSDKWPECMAAAVNNAVQIVLVSGGLIRIQPLDNHYNGSLSQRDLMGELPEVDSPMNILAILNIIGAPNFPSESEFATFSPIALHFNEMNQRVIDLADYEASNPNAMIRSIEENTQIYEIFNGRAEERDHFMQMQLEWGIIRIIVIEKPADDDYLQGAVGDTVPHVVAFHRRGERYYVIEGAEGGSIYRIESKARFADLLFTANGRMQLLHRLGGPFLHASFEEDDDNGMISNALIVPKVTFEGPYRGNDNRTLDQILNETPPSFPVRTLGAAMNDAPFVISYVPSNSPEITDL